MIRTGGDRPYPLHNDHQLAARDGAVCDTAANEIELKRRVLNFLATRDRPGLRLLDVDVDGDVVVLSGSVRSFYEKQLASHCCSRVAGVHRVVNDVFVQPATSEALAR